MWKGRSVSKEMYAERENNGEGSWGQDRGVSRWKMDV